MLFLPLKTSPIWSTLYTLRFTRHLPELTRRTSAVGSYGGDYIAIRPMAYSKLKSMIYMKATHVPFSSSGSLIRPRAVHALLGTLCRPLLFEDYRVFCVHFQVEFVNAKDV
jgi:hypothetical protein